MVVVKSFFMFVIGCGMLACFLVSYSYISGDREDREDMQATFAQYIQRVHPNAAHEARSLSSLEVGE